VLDRVRTRTDIREQVVGFPPQAVITRDNLVVGIDSVIYYSITDPAAAQYKIENVVVAIEQLVVTTLRNVVGGMQLEEALTGRDHINERLATVLDEATGKWGVKVNRVEIRGIEPPPTIRDAMEQAMRADRGKRAAILTARASSSPWSQRRGRQAVVVLNAEAERTATILRAEADRESALLRAQGEAQAIAMVVAAIKEAGVDDTVLAFQRQQLLPRIAEGDANKVWFVPTDMAGMLGQLGIGNRPPAPPRHRLLPLLRPLLLHCPSPPRPAARTSRPVRAAAPGRLPAGR
jgi:regulator of protease activity HflC (stomatin/prohibitin superfamily)